MRMISFAVIAALLAARFAVADDQNARLKKFESDVTAVIRWHEAKQQENRRDNRAVDAHTVEFVKKLRAAENDGVPEDLKSAYLAFATALSDFHSVVVNGPKDGAAAEVMARLSISSASNRRLIRLRMTRIHDSKGDSWPLEENLNLPV